MPRARASRTLESDSGTEDLEMEMALKAFRIRLQGGGTTPRHCTIDAPVPSPDQSTLDALPARKRRRRRSRVEGRTTGRTSLDINSTVATAPRASGFDPLAKPVSKAAPYNVFIGTRSSSSADKLNNARTTSIRTAVRQQKGIFDDISDTDADAQSHMQTLHPTVPPGPPWKISPDSGATMKGGLSTTQHDEGSSPRALTVEACPQFAKRWRLFLSHTRGGGTRPKAMGCT